MSRIGKKPVIIPPGVEVKINGSSISVKGPRGELKKEFSPLVSFRIADGLISVWVTDNAPKPLWGLSRALVNNMIKGVSVGFEKVLEFNGVGFKAQVKGLELELDLGYTNPVTVKASPSIHFAVEKNVIKVTGTDKEMVGQIAAQIRAARPPEPYKGTGVKYSDEVIKRKAGKKAVTGT